MKNLLLKTAAEIIVGLQSRKRIEHDEAGTHQMVQGRDLQPGRGLCGEGLLKFTPKRVPGACVIGSGDILFQARGGEHVAQCVSDPPPNTVASSAFYIIRPRKDLLTPQYLTWWINQPPAQRYFQAASQQTSMPFVSKAVLSRLNIRIPDFDVQKTIQQATDLMQKEHRLRRKISDRRMQLVNAACMAALNKGGV